jgi:hypothetical protein
MNPSSFAGRPFSEYGRDEEEMSHDDASLLEPFSARVSVPDKEVVDDSFGERYEQELLEGPLGEVSQTCCISDSCPMSDAELMVFSALT